MGKLNGEEAANEDSSPLFILTQAFSPISSPCHLPDRENPVSTTSHPLQTIRSHFSACSNSSPSKTHPRAPLQSKHTFLAGEQCLFPDHVSYKRGEEHGGIGCLSPGFRHQQHSNSFGPESAVGSLASPGSVVSGRSAPPSLGACRVPTLQDDGSPTAPLSSHASAARWGSRPCTHGPGAHRLPLELTCREGAAGTTAHLRSGKRRGSQGPAQQPVER